MLYNFPKCGVLIEILPAMQCFVYRVMSKPQRRVIAVLRRECPTLYSKYCPLCYVTPINVHSDAWSNYTIICILEDWCSTTGCSEQSETFRQGCQRLCGSAAASEATGMQCGCQLSSCPNIQHCVLSALFAFHHSIWGENGQVKEWSLSKQHSWILDKEHCTKQLLPSVSIDQYVNT